MPLPAWDMTQPKEGETIEEYNDRPLFPRPSIAKVLNRHAGSVLGRPDPHVDLNSPTMNSELADFEDAWGHLCEKDNTLQLAKFDQLLKKLNIHLSKDLYIKLVDDNVENHHNHIQVVDDSLDRDNALTLYEKILAPAHYYGTHLRKAAGRNAVEIVEELVARGCDVNTADGNHYTPLHHATTHGCKEVIKALKELSGKGGRKKAKLVVDAPDSRGWTPLHIAASNGLVDIFKLLCDMGGDPGLGNKEGRNCLHIACGKGMDKVVKMLLATSTGSHLVNTQSLKGWTPLFEACFHAHDHVIAMLQKAKSKRDIEDILEFKAEKYYSGRKDVFADWE